MKNTTTQNSGITFMTLLGLLFIGLKLTNYIDWSWWWVLLPIYLQFAILLAMLVFMCIVWVIVAILEWATK